MPTAEQSLQSVQLCHWLSTFYTSIHLYRYDEKRQEIFILAGEDLMLTIYASGQWEFNDEPEA